MFGKRKNKRCEIFYDGLDYKVYRPSYMDWRDLRKSTKAKGSTKVELTNEEKLAAEETVQALCGLIGKERVL